VSRYRPLQMFAVRSSRPHSRMLATISAEPYIAGEERLTATDECSVCVWDSMVGTVGVSPPTNCAAVEHKCASLEHKARWALSREAPLLFRAALCYIRVQMCFD
jgi:hypothetical protein